MSNLKDIVLPFYTKALTVNSETTPTEVLKPLLADGFISYSSVDHKTKEQLIGQLEFFWKMIPDLKWEPLEIIEKDNQVIVRSRASGTPNSPEGNFFGVTTDGTKLFSMMTIDIHTIENGLVSHTHHVEDWATALKQMKQ